MSKQRSSPFFKGTVANVSFRASSPPFSHLASAEQATFGIAQHSLGEKAPHVRR